MIYDIKLLTSNITINLFKCKFNLQYNPDLHLFNTSEFLPQARLKYQCKNMKISSKNYNNFPTEKRNRKAVSAAAWTTAAVYPCPQIRRVRNSRRRKYLSLLYQAICLARLRLSK